MLFLLTFVSTTTLGAGWFLATRTDLTYSPANSFGGMAWLGPQTIVQIWGSPEMLRLGLAFSIPALVILLCHELGHYRACRHYGIPATWPHFLPVPIGLGTFGAFIRIKAPLRNKRQLFDIAVAGPIAGFAALLPILFYGMAHSIPRSVAIAEPLSTNWVLYLPGRSILFRWVQSALHGAPVPGQVLDLHPFALAAWVGLLVTSLNLLPFGQLDGGHILYAAVGRHHRKIMLPLWGLMVLGGFYWPGWWVWSFLVLLMRLRHQPVRDQALPLDRRRKLLALAALGMLLLCFMPVPLEMIWVEQ